MYSLPKTGDPLSSAVDHPSDVGLALTATLVPSSDDAVIWQSFIVSSPIPSVAIFSVINANTDV